MWFTKDVTNRARSECPPVKRIRILIPPEETVSSARTRIERDFDPEAVRQMKAPAGRDITVGGPDLAAQAAHQDVATNLGATS
jgi:hypothetical protein